jgi:hypothetical protein
VASALFTAGTLSPQCALAERYLRASSRTNGDAAEIIVTAPGKLVILLRDVGPAPRKGVVAFTNSLLPV